LRSGKKPREGTEHLKISRCHARRRDDHQRNARVLYLFGAELAHDVARRNAERDGHFADRVSAEVYEEGALAHRDDVLSSQLIDAMRKLVGIRDRAGRKQTVEQRSRRFAKRPLLERNEDAIGSEELGELHGVRCRMSSTTSTGRVATPIPAS
jgi:hypothetical protein